MKGLSGQVNWLGRILAVKQEGSTRVTKGLRRVGQGRSAVCGDGCGGVLTPLVS